MDRYIKAGGVASAVLSSVTFGLIPLFSIPLLGAGLGAPTILTFRFLVAAAMMALVVVASGRSLKLPRRSALAVVVLSALYALTAIMLLQSYRYIPSGVSTTIHFLYPLAVTLSMSIIFKEPTTRLTYIAVIVSLAGVALLAWGDHEASDFGRGVLLSLLTVATYAAYIVGVMKSRAARIDSVVLAFYVLAIGAAMFMLYALMTTGVQPVKGVANWRNILLLALLSTVISDFALILAIKRIGSTMTSILGSMEPLTAVIVGVVYFHEHFDMPSVAGLILIIVAVVIVIAQTDKSTTYTH